MKTVDVPAVFGLSDYAPRPQIDTAARISLSQDEIDAVLEREIQFMHDLAMKYVSGDPMLAREMLAVMAMLVGKRSQEQRERMEAKLPKKWGTR